MSHFTALATLNTVLRCACVRIRVREQILRPFIPFKFKFQHIDQLPFMLEENRFGTEEEGKKIDLSWTTHNPKATHLIHSLITASQLPN